MGHEKAARARSMAELGALFGRIAPDEAVLAASPPYRVEPGDVIITPFGKCGTTMLQQAFHQLRTGGDMDFDDISRVVPWIEMAAVLGEDINAPQRAAPRGFKSHRDYEALPPGARYVVSFREPGAAFLSHYHFMEGWTFEPGTIGLEDYADHWIEGGGPSGSNYWSHLLSWWARRDEPDTLLLAYSATVADRRGAIRRLADFCEIPCNAALLDLATRRTGREYMLEHKDRFDDAMMRTMFERRGPLPPGSDSAKVRALSAPRRELPQALSDRFAAIWRERVAPVTGHADFAALDADLLARNRSARGLHARRLPR